MGAAKPDSRGLIAARKLFARTLETPGGLKIQTIHAFCERLLHLFPFEANVPSRFEVMDEAHQEELLARARRTVLAEANSHKGSLGAAVQRITDECGPDGFEDLIKETMRHAAIFCARGLRDPAEVLRRTLGLAKGRDIALIEREMVEDGIAPGRWNDVAGLLDQGSTKRSKTGRLCSGKPLRPIDQLLPEDALVIVSIPILPFSSRQKRTPQGCRD